MLKVTELLSSKTEVEQRPPDSLKRTSPTKLCCPAVRKDMQGKLIRPLKLNVRFTLLLTTGNGPGHHPFEEVISG